MMIPLLLSAALALQDPSAAAKAAIEKTRASESYKVAFKSTVKVPKSDAIVTQGDGVWLKPGVLYIYSKSTGGREQRIVRVGQDVQLYTEDSESWEDSATLGQTTAGRGVENPDETLAVLAKHLEKAQWGADKKTIRLAMQGADIAKIAREQGDAAFDWENSSAEIDLTLAGDGRIAAVRCSSRLASKDAAMKGTTADYTADVTIVSYDKDRELKFELTDPVTKRSTPIEVPADLKARIEAQLKKK